MRKLNKKVWDRLDGEWRLRVENLFWLTLMSETKNKELTSILEDENEEDWFYKLFPKLEGFDYSSGITVDEIVRCGYGGFLVEIQIPSNIYRNNKCVGTSYMEYMSKYVYSETLEGLVEEIDKAYEIARTHFNNKNLK